MAVQRKSNSNGPGEKKKANWIQIGAVAFILLVVVMCVLSFSNFSNFFNGNAGSTGLSGTVADGDHAAIYFETKLGNTTTFSYMPSSDGSTDLQPYAIYASKNATVSEDDYQSIVLRIGNVTIPYAVYGLEKNAIANGIVGAQYGTMVTVQSPYHVLVNCSAANLTDLGYDIKEVKVGDILPMSLGYQDVLGETKSYLRNGVVTSIANDSSCLMVNCGADSIDVYLYGKYNA